MISDLVKELNALDDLICDGSESFSSKIGDLKGLANAMREDRDRLKADNDRLGELNAKLVCEVSALKAEIARIRWEFYGADPASPSEAVEVSAVAAHELRELLGSLDLFRVTAARALAALRTVADKGEKS